MSESRAVWTDGIEPGRQAVVLGVAATLSVVALNLMLVGELTMFFDLCFVCLCLGLALVVKPRDFFNVGVLPPLLMVVVFAFLALVAPGAIAEPDDGFVQAVVSGLAHHSGGLVAGYAVCLGTLALRQRSLRSHQGIVEGLIEPEPEPTAEQEPFDVSDDEFVSPRTD